MKCRAIESSKKSFQDHCKSRIVLGVCWSILVLNPKSQLLRFKEFCIRLTHVDSLKWAVLGVLTPQKCCKSGLFPPTSPGDLVVRHLLAHIWWHFRLYTSINRQLHIFSFLLLLLAWTSPSFSFLIDKMWNLEFRSERDFRKYLVQLVLFHRCY